METSIEEIFHRVSTIDACRINRINHEIEMYWKEMLESSDDFFELDTTMDNDELADYIWDILFEHNEEYKFDYDYYKEQRMNDTSIEPDIHDQHSLHSQLIVNRTSQINSRESLTSYKSSHSIDRYSPTNRIQGRDRTSPDNPISSQERDSPNHRVFSWDKTGPNYRSSRKNRVHSNHRLSPNRLIYSRDSEERGQEDTYRVISELVPSTTSRIHEAIIDTARPEVILDVDQLQHESRVESCTCWQCTGSRKSSKSSLIQDENSNIIHTG